MKGNLKSGRDTNVLIQSKGILGAQDANVTIQSKRTQSKGAPGGQDTCLYLLNSYKTGRFKCDYLEQPEPLD